jgi:NADPH-dependent 2,4-dienoyl-CoA reductase/sulfur reductase-like enzyme
MKRIAVVGGGLAGATLIQALRRRGFDGELTLVSAEAHLPYDRPPLSKEFMAGDDEPVSLALDLDELAVQVRSGCRAVGVGDGILETDSGPLPFDALVIATGARAMKLPGNGSELLLRTVDDARRLRDHLKPDARIVIVGAGWIGAEIATAAVARGCQVTVVEWGGAPLTGALPVVVGGRTAQWYHDAGVDLRVDTRVELVEPAGVKLATGEFLAADAVLVAVGAKADIEWLEGSGLEVGRHGLLVDDRLRTSDDRIYGIGDAAEWSSHRYGRQLLVQHWDHALRSAEVAAANLLGEDEVYDPVPYFWSDQFGRKIQMVGHISPDDELVVRGDPNDEAWMLAWISDRRLKAFVGVNRPREILQARRLIEQGNEVDLAKLTDASILVRDA